MKHVLILSPTSRGTTPSGLMAILIQTPNLDRLVADSIVFERCITPSPVCVPALLSLMSGRYRRVPATTITTRRKNMRVSLTRN